MADIKGNLRRFSDMENVDIAEGDPDPRGWDVVSRDGRELGEVEDLVVDTNAMKVRCLEVSLDKDTFGIDDDRHVLLPLETAHLDPDDDKVIVSTATDAIAALPPFSGEAVEADYYRGFGNYGRDRAALPAQDTERAAEDWEDTRRLTRAEEELRISKRQASAGEVRASKHVESEHVRQPVTRQREVARVERRPVSGENVRGGSIGTGNDELRVPLVEEQVIVEKRPVVKEELIISKDTVTETQDVDAEVRKERFDVQQSGDKANRDRIRKEGR